MGMKKNQSNSSKIRARIEGYILMPLWMVLPLLVLNIYLYTKNVDWGIICTVMIVLYILIALLIYMRTRPLIMSNLMAFAFEQGQVQKALLKDLAVPYALLDEDGRILWGNRLFYEIAGGKTATRTLMQLFPDISKETFNTDVPVTEYNLLHAERDYRVEFRHIHVNDILREHIVEEEEALGMEAEEQLIAAFFFDETELRHYMRENKEQKLVAGLIYIDNYEEALEGIEEVRRPLLTALIDRKIDKYLQNLDAIVKKMEKDKYIAVFQQRHMEQLQATKFSLLEEVRSINIGNEVAMTLSIGLGVNEDNYQAAYNAARVAIDLALGRGGDQAVVKDGEQIVYYGGKSQGVEKNTRVKARVKAHALREVLETKDRVIIMGHRIPDVDCLGSAIGVYRIAESLNRKAHIVVNDVTVAIRPVMNQFVNNSNYAEDLFLNSEQAMSIIDANTVLVVVDVNRPSYTECPELLNMTKSIVVIDHHRAMSDSIQNAVLSYVEPYASSACEMVAEILQYIIDKPKLKTVEADAMYSGILVDTDNFVTKTGVRTFEAAAFLRRSGADVVRVRKMFRTDLAVYKQKMSGVENAEMFLEDYVIGVLDPTGVDSPTVLSAQIANELLDIDGVKASFMLTKVKDTVYISARSIDEVNVQVIMERLGGGGHASVAGAQLQDCTIEEGKLRLKEELEEMTLGGDL